MFPTSHYSFSDPDRKRVDCRATREKSGSGVPIACDRDEKAGVQGQIGVHGQGVAEGT